MSKTSPIANLPGIGYYTPKALVKYGMDTIGKFAMLTEQEARLLLGGSGVKLLRIAKSI